MISGVPFFSPCDLKYPQTLGENQNAQRWQTHTTSGEVSGDPNCSPHFPPHAMEEKKQVTGTSLLDWSYNKMHWTKKAEAQNSNDIIVSTNIIVAIEVEHYRNAREMPEMPENIKTDTTICLHNKSKHNSKHIHTSPVRRHTKNCRFTQYLKIIYIINR